MRLFHKILLFFIVLLAMGTYSKADIKADLRVAAGDTDNLMNDSSNTKDSFRIYKLATYIYPLTPLKIEVQGEYTIYRSVAELSNFMGGVGVTYIPLRQQSDFSCCINSNFKSRVYREGYEDFDNNYFDAAFGISYTLGTVASLRCGTGFNSTKYTNEKDTSTIPNTFKFSGDNSSIEAFFGANITLPWSNTIDIEAGLASMSLTYVKPPIDLHDYLEPALDTAIDGHLKSFYISPRFSRPIGRKFGLNITYIHRQFRKSDSMIIAGLSSAFLSPWTQVYEGNSVTVSLKTYVIPDCIVSAGAGHWHKDYLKGEEKRPQHGLPKPPTIIKSRHDGQNKLFFSIQMPLRLKTSTTIEPAIQIDYSNNNSSNKLYDYSCISVAGGVTIKM